MKKFIDTLRDIFSIEDLRTRILTTLGLILVFRLGSSVVLPGVNPDKLEESSSGIFGFFDNFVGGAFSNASVFALGIMPYISASIVLQLLQVAVPYFQRLQKEGESGRKKINQYTRFLTILVTMMQGIAYVNGMIPKEAVVIDPTLFKISAVIIITAGTMFCMWLGEKITDKGIGNGVSMLIMVGIVSRFPNAIGEEINLRGMDGILWLVIEAILFFVVIMGVVMLTQATRRIPVQYAKQIVGGKVFGGQRQYIPLKLNSSGVMPIIFAQALMFVPAIIGSALQENSFGQQLQMTFNDQFSLMYNVVLGVMIITFTYFYTAITVNPTQIADDLKRNNGFIPGVKPGKSTSDFIDTILSRITLPGALFLVAVSILPAFAAGFVKSKEFALFYGGTSLLIVVGVIFDTIQQVQTFLLSKDYERMMNSGRTRRVSSEMPTVTEG